VCIVKSIVRADLTGLPSEIRYVHILRQRLIKVFPLSASLHLAMNPRRIRNFIKFDVGDVYLNLLMNSVSFNPKSHDRPLTYVFARNVLNTFIGGENF
jgi:hypothetical protein